jgi:hypothetical protein
MTGARQKNCRAALQCDAGKGRTQVNIDPGGKGRNEFLLAELRCAALRARLWQIDIDSIGIALRGSLVTPEQAIEMLADRDLLDLVGTEPGGPA